MKHYLGLHSHEPVTPRQQDVLKTLLDDYRKTRGVTVQVIDPQMCTRVLVLGSLGPEWAGNRIMQYTYSLKQLESRANAATVFFAALDTYFGLVEGLPARIHRAEYQSIAFTESFIALNFDLNQPIAVDVETGGILGETVSSRTAPMICIAFAQGANAVALNLSDTDQYALERDDKLKWLAEFLPLIQKPIFHNGKFDIQVILSNTGVRMPNWFDTMLAHHVLNQAAREHGLKPLCARYFNAEDWEMGIKRHLGKGKDYRAIPFMHLGTYNNFDVLWTYRLWQKLSVEIEADEAAQTAFFLEMQAADFLMDVEATGIPFSRKEADNLRVHYAVEKGMNLDMIRFLLDKETFNPGSPLQVKLALQGMGVEVKGTKEEIIQGIIDSTETGEKINRFCVYLLAYRKAQKMLSTYVDAWDDASRVEGDGRVHPTFKVHGTTTGRLSSSDPNAQNVPRDKTIRKMVTLDE